jgi:hypothetical protein
MSKEIIRYNVPKNTHMRGQKARPVGYIPSLPHVRSLSIDNETHDHQDQLVMYTPPLASRNYMSVAIRILGPLYCKKEKII